MVTRASIINKYRCLPLPLKGLRILAHNLARFVVPRYPLEDRSGSICQEPLFIIGAGRSGTTLLRSMLVAGDSIAIPPETQIFQNLVVEFATMQNLGWDVLCGAMIARLEKQHNFNQWSTDLVPAYQRVKDLSQPERSLARILDEVFKTYAAQHFPNAVMWGDQSPIYTFYLPYIRKVFPHAKYLHMLRDGRDAVASFVEKDGQDFFEEGIYRWSESVRRARQLQKQVGPRNFIEIRYEDLVTHPEPTLQKISEYLGIEYKPQMLDYWKMDSTVEGKFYEHHRNLEKPVFASSIGSWEKRLSTEQKETLLKNISALLSELSYI